jgi:tryptophan synthase beta chain
MVCEVSFKEALGRFGPYGGRFVPESLYGPCQELEEAFNYWWSRKDFKSRYQKILKDYAGRPTPLSFARNLSEHLGINLYFKREDLAHTGSHKINNVVGQALLAKAMGKTQLIAETGAGQHGVATATAGAYFGFETVVYMGELDVNRQALNVFRMKLLGAKVNAVTSGSKTLKDAINEALRAWVAQVDTTHYLIGSVMGPHPYPTMVREFQRIIGKETKAQFEKLVGGCPDYIVACVGGGSNAIGIFYDFLNTEAALVGVEAEGGAALTHGIPGVVHGMASLLLQDEGGQILEAHSISAGLDYPGVGPEHAFLKDSGRVRYFTATDKEVLNAFKEICAKEGILPALESTHAVAWVIKAVNEGIIKPGANVVVNMSGRGDKDIEIVKKFMEAQFDI